MLDSLKHDVDYVRKFGEKRPRPGENWDDIEQSFDDLSNLCRVLSKCHKKADPAEIDTQEVDGDSQATVDCDSQ